MCVHLTGEDTGAPYLTLKRLAVWVSEPMLRLKTLASLTDALETLPAGKLIAALDAAAQHGDPSVSATVSDFTPSLAQGTTLTCSCLLSPLSLLDVTEMTCGMEIHGDTAPGHVWDVPDKAEVLLRWRAAT